MVLEGGGFAGGFGDPKTIGPRQGLTISCSKSGFAPGGK